MIQKDSPLTSKVRYFKYCYSVLVKYFTGNEVYLQGDPTLDKDFEELYLLLEYCDYNPLTFLFSNFRSYAQLEGFPYPYIRYLLNNRICFDVLYEFHRKHGDSHGIINYTDAYIHIVSMRNSSYYWVNAKELTFERKVQALFNNLDDSFKVYLYNRHFNMFRNLGVTFNLRMKSLSNKVLLVVPYYTLDRIYNEVEQKYGT